MKLAVIPGTYDPLTKGHYDIISRAADLFDRVLVAVAASPGKHPIFTLDERIEICKASFRGIENIGVEGFSGLLVSFLREKGAHVLVRGLRSAADFDYESQLAGMYRDMLPSMEIIYLPASSGCAYISSTLVRDIAFHHGDIGEFVPAGSRDLIRELLERKRQEKAASV